VIEVNAIPLARVGSSGSREQHYSVAEIAQDWGLSENTVRKLFESEDGVIKVQSPHATLVKNPNKKPRTSLRISASARDRVYASLAGGFASKVKATSRRIE
jgi:predicted transcriptional regulator